MALRFERFEISKYDEYKKVWVKCDEYSSDMSFVILWAWQDYFGYEMCRDGDLIWLRQTKPDLKWLAPAGNWHRDDWEELLLSHVGRQAEFVAVPKTVVEIWKQQLGSKITAEADRDAFEYLYDVQELATLAGNRHMKRRNRVNKFRRKYSANYLSLTPEMTEEVKALQGTWLQEEGDKVSEILAAEVQSSLRVLDHWQEFGLFGGVIELDGRFIAYELAEEVTPDVVMVHYEKGLPEFSEVYQVINKDFLANDAIKYKIVNREEDMGDPGLRQAKMAYLPCGFVEKYNVKWNADA